MSILLLRFSSPGFCFLFRSYNLRALIECPVLHPQLGFEVLEAENGLQCIDVVNQERTQLVCVFLDLQMPVADGWTATRGIRELESRTGNRDDLPVPVVVCTASCLDDLVDDGQTVAQRAVSLGANGAVVSDCHRLLLLIVYTLFYACKHQSFCLESSGFSTSLDLILARIAAHR